MALRLDLTSASLTQAASLHQLVLALGKVGLRLPLELVAGREIANAAMRSLAIVAGDVLGITKWLMVAVGCQSRLYNSV